MSEWSKFAFSPKHWKWPWKNKSMFLNNRPSIHFSDESHSIGIEEFVPKNSLGQKKFFGRWTKFAFSLKAPQFDSPHKMVVVISWVKLMIPKVGGTAIHYLCSTCQTSIEFFIIDLPREQRCLWTRLHIWIIKAIRVVKRTQFFDSLPSFILACKLEVIQLSCPAACLVHWKVK